jgi:hypothetical protein
MTALAYISDTEEIVKAFWSNFQQDCVAECKLWERSPLPPTLSAENLAGEWTQAMNDHQMKRIHCHPVVSDVVSAPISLVPTNNWLNRI